MCLTGLVWAGSNRYEWSCIILYDVVLCLTGLVWAGSNRYEWSWAERLGRRLASDLQMFKLLMQVIFCNEPEPPSRDVVAVK